MIKEVGSLLKTMTYVIISSDSALKSFGFSCLQNSDGVIYSCIVTNCLVLEDGIKFLGLQYTKGRGFYCVDYFYLVK